MRINHQINSRMRDGFQFNRATKANPEIQATFFWSPKCGQAVELFCRRGPGGWVSLPLEALPPNTRLALIQAWESGMAVFR